LGPPGDEYSSRILGTEASSLVGYWPLWDAGTAAVNVQGAGRAGTHTAVAMSNAGIGDGRTSGLYDGSTSYTNIYTAEMAGTELITNGGFETAGGGGADIWGTWEESTGTGAIADEGALVHGGSHAAKLTAGASWWDTFIKTPPLVVVAGATYQLTFWTRGDGTSPGRYGIWNSSSASWIAANISTGVAGTTYTQVSVPFTAPAGCIAVRIYLYPPNVNGGIAYFDDVSVKAVNPFNGAEGTLLIWAKVSAAGVWTDGAARGMVYLVVDANNKIFLAKNSTDNQIIVDYKAGGTDELATFAATSLNFMAVAATWSQSGDSVKWYLNGAQAASATSIGTWAGTPAATTTVIGAGTTVPANVWSGSLAHCALWSKALSADQIAYLSKV
jgi:hypothetical protein